MKKFLSLIVLILIVTISLTSCTPSKDSTQQNVTTDPPFESTSNNDNVTPVSHTSQETSPNREIVTLTKDNYQQYISIHMQVFNNEYNRAFCGYNFVGSSVCKFNNVEISYSLEGLTTVQVCSLNMSGYGQTTFSRWSNNYVPELTIRGITGTVEILY